MIKFVPWADCFDKPCKRHIEKQVLSPRADIRYTWPKQAFSHSTKTSFHIPICDALATEIISVRNDNGNITYCPLNTRFFVQPIHQRSQNKHEYFLSLLSSGHPFHIIVRRHPIIGWHSNSSWIWVQWASHTGLNFLWTTDWNSSSTWQLSLAQRTSTSAIRTFLFLFRSTCSFRIYLYKRINIRCRRRGAVWRDFLMMFSNGLWSDSIVIVSRTNK